MLNRIDQLLISTMEHEEKDADRIQLENNLPAEIQIKIYQHIFKTESGKKLLQNLRRKFQMMFTWEM